MNRNVSHTQTVMTIVRILMISAMPMDVVTTISLLCGGDAGRGRSNTFTQNRCGCVTTFGT